MGVFRHGIARALKIKKKNKTQTCNLVPFRRVEADVLFVFNNMFFKDWVSSEAFHHP